MTKFDLNDSIIVSKKFFEMLEERLSNVDINGYYNNFNNCREQGFVLTLYEADLGICIWACQERSSDNIMVIIADESMKNINYMFNEEAYKKVKYFKNGDYDSAVNFTFNNIKKIFKNQFESSYKFDLKKSLEEIKNIQAQLFRANFNDFIELAYFEDIDKKFSCDLVIWEGKMCYRYNKNNLEYVDTLELEEVSPDLKSELNLMLDMKKKLNNYLKRNLNISLRYVGL